MSLLKEYIQSLLFEGRLEDLQKKYPNIDVKELAANDPSPTKKYVEWMIKQLSQGVKKEDLVPTIQYFNRNQNKFQKKDINQYKSLKDLEDAAKDAESKKSNTQQRKIAKAEGTEKIYEDEKILVLRIDTKEACVFYGSNTRWCITMKDSSYYEQYKSSNVIFYFVLSKVKRDDDFNKIALAYERDDDNNISQLEIFDEKDNPIDRNEFIHAIHGEEEDLNKDNEILKITLNDAIKQPKSFLSRLKTKKYETQELKDYLETIKISDQPDEDKASYLVDLVQYVRPEERVLFFDFNYPSVLREVMEMGVEYIPVEKMLVLLNDRHLQNFALDSIIKEENYDYTKIINYYKSQILPLKKLHNEIIEIVNSEQFNSTDPKFADVFKKIALSGITDVNNVLDKPAKSWSDVHGDFRGIKSIRFEDKELNEKMPGFSIVGEKIKTFIKEYRRLYDLIFLVHTERIIDKLQKESKYPNLKNVFSEWSQHLDMVMFDIDDNEEQEDDFDRPADERNASNPFDANDSPRTSDAKGVGRFGYNTRVAGNSGPQSGRTPGGRNQGITGR